MAEDWDALAAGFDEEPDHGLRDPGVREAWRALLAGVLPAAPAAVADLGCGTGTLSLLLAEQGHAVSGMDRSPAMLERARAKAGARATFLPLGDAAAPPLRPHGFDVVVARHVLFLFEDPAAVLGRWVRLLRPGGRLVLIEGFWSTGSGLHADEAERHVRLHRAESEVVRLDGRPELWGGPVDDERYLLVSRT